MPRRPPPPPESVVQAQCFEVLKSFGVDCKRQNTGAAMQGGRLVRYGEKGDPDITGVLPDGRRLDLEVKRPGARPTAEQLDRLRRTNAAGGVGLWTDDPVALINTIRRLLSGWRVEIDNDGTPWVTDDPKRINE